MSSRFLVASALGSVLCLASAGATAHFRLEQPPASHAQNGQGNPQKAAPCGGGIEPTGEVTVVQEGGKLTVTIDETVFHPGHYRVSIAQNEAGLPADPVVTEGASECGSAEIDPNPSLPVIADGIFEHDAAFSGPQTLELDLPPGFACDNCVVQVLEFMSSHGAPCFYYHCATVTVEGEPAMTTAASTSTKAAASSGAATKAASVGATSGGGTTSGTGGGGGAAGEDDGGCAVSAPDDGTKTAGFAALVVLGAAVALRRRAARR